MKKIFIGVPCMDFMHYQYVTSLIRMKTPPGTTIWHLALSLPYIAREMIVEKADQEGYDYVMFLDSDMVPEPDTIERLLAHDVDIVSASIFQRKPPYTPCFYKKIRLGEPGESNVEPLIEYDRGLIEVEGIGSACCLIKMDVFRKIRDMPRQQHIWPNNSPVFFPIPGYGEDLSFCIRARMAGFKIYVDTTLQCGHVGTLICNETTFKSWEAQK